jgi:putative sterol carrier protein
VIAAARRAEANGAAAPVGRGGIRGAIQRRIRDAGESALGAFVRGRTDAQLSRTLGSGPGLRMMFKGMERAFIPEKANGFAGEVQYELSGTRNGQGEWVVRIEGDRATVAPGRAAQPLITMRMSVPVFARIAARELHPGKAMMEGQLELEGDFEAAARVGEMFGAESLV